MHKEWLIIFCEGDAEWDLFCGTIDEAIAHVKTDHRWCNYGRKGAVIVPYVPHYEIKFGTVERRIIDGERYINEKFYVDRSNAALSDNA